MTIVLHIAPDYIGPSADSVLRGAVETLVRDGLLQHAVTTQLFPNDDVLELRGIYTISYDVPVDLTPVIEHLRQLPGVDLSHEALDRSVSDSQWSSNVRTGQEALSVVLEALSVPGVDLGLEEEIPKYHVDTEGRLVRVQGNRREHVEVVNGKFLKI